MIRVFTAFSGYDSQCLALNRLHDTHNIDYDLVGWSEIDKYAIEAHNALFPQWENRNYGDISTIDWAKVPDFDLFTYSSPCQDFSIAGKQAGGAEGSGTRSSLLWECRRAIIAKRPRYLLLENVKALTSNKFRPLLMKWCFELESYGYLNYIRVLNAKDYGVPQNRERVFVFSTLSRVPFIFPQPFTLARCVKDLLEEEIDERCYLRNEVVERFLQKMKQNKERGVGFAFRPTDINGVAHTLTVGGPNSYSDPKWIAVPKVFQVGNMVKKSDFKNPCRGRVYSPDGLAPTLCAMSGGQLEPKIVNNNTTAIRKLTPRECFRLMGVQDSDIDKIKRAGISWTQQYKMAGNSIVVDVLYHIFRQAFTEEKDNNNRLL
mgnify:CR=1 FL=1